MPGTDRGRSDDERALERYETILETIDDAVFVIGEDRSVEYANESALTRADTTLEDLRGTPVMALAERFVVEEQTDRFESALETVFAEEGEFPVTLELELELPTGRGVAEYRLSPSHEEGTVTGAVVVARDVTERTEQEKRLRLHDEQLSRLHEATRDLFDAGGPRDVAELASDAAADILGLPLNGVHFHDEAAGGLTPVAVSDAGRELLGEVPVIDDGIAWESFQQGEFRIYDDIHEAQNVYNPETPIRSEMYLPLADRGVFIIGSPVVGVFDDTDVELAQTLAANTGAALQRVDREQELRAREKRLVRKNERLDEFASVVSHDLRNPLNVAKGRVELARADCDSEHLDAAIDAHDRMDTLIQDLLTLAQQGEMVDEMEAVHLPELLDGCWRNVPTSDATRVIETDQTIRADRSRLRQLVDNLVGNAIEHGGRGVTVTVGALPDGFYVADDGPGIPEDEQDAVFEVGYSTTEEGSGFGLSIVKEIANAHGWGIAVTDSGEGGARFEITGVESCSD